MLKPGVSLKEPTFNDQNLSYQYAMGNFKFGYSKGYVAPGLTDKNTNVTMYEAPMRNNFQGTDS